MINVLIFTAIAIVSYLIGNINMAKIIAWHRRKKDITQLGSGNPGTMNMLRNFGFWIAFGTMLLEFFKTGLCCILSGIIMREQGLYHFAYYFAGAFVVIGSVYPIGTKGGKGLACLAGIFMCSPLWYVGIGLFVLGFILLLIVDYAFVPTTLFCVLMTIALTIYFSIKQVTYFWAIIVIIWLLLALILYNHRGNFKRLFRKEEKKLGFAKMIKKMFKKQRGVDEISEDSVESEPEKEIIIEDDKDNQN